MNELENCFETGTRYQGNDLLHQGHQIHVTQLANQNAKQELVPRAKRGKTSNQCHANVVNRCMSQRAEAATFYDLGQVPVVRKVDNAIIHSINHYPVDTVACFVNTYPLDIPPTSRVRDPYCKLRTEFFPVRL